MTNSNEWWLILVLSIAMNSLLAATISNSRLRRHHSAFRQFSEWLAKHQLGFGQYYTTILISGAVPQPPGTVTHSPRPADAVGLGPQCLGQS